jgi:hypothetical protein
MDAATRQLLLDRYAAGPAVVAAAWARVPEDRRDRRPAPDAWTAREVVHHLADSETCSYGRLRHLLAEDEPVIHAYDQDLWATRLRYDRPVETSLAVLTAVRASSAELLALADEADWVRWGTHTEDGRYTLERWLELYAAHAHDHADQLLEAAGLESLPTS